MPSGALSLAIVSNGGEMMSQVAPQNALPDEDTLQVWEDMRSEILHELQDGASADIPDSVIDELGTLVAVMTTTRKKRLRVRIIKRPNSQLAKRND